MSNIKPSDLFVVGRNDTSYNVPFADVLTSVGGDLIPDPNNDNQQPNTLDERYVNVLGDTMTGRLDIKVDSGAALRMIGGFAFKKQGETIDGVNLFYSGLERVSYEGLMDIDTDIVTVGFVKGITDGILTEINDINVEIGDIKSDIGDLQTALDNEITRATEKETEILDELTKETNRAEGAESDLEDKIDALKLNNLADVTVGGATNNQVLYYDEDASEWKAKEIVFSSILTYKGDIDLTAPAPVAEEGDLYINTTTSGDVDSSFGTNVQTSLPNGVSGGEMVSLTPSGWLYVGGIGGGLSYDSFDVDNIDPPSGSKGELSYNPSNGKFTFTRVDLDSRVPMNIGSLAPLPV